MAEKRLPIRVPVGVGGSYHPPSVTGILVFNDPALWRLARLAAASFAAQAYPRKNLVVVNVTPPVPAPVRPLTPDEIAGFKAGRSFADLGVPTRLRQPLVLPPEGLAGAAERLVDLDDGARLEPALAGKLFDRALTMSDGDYVVAVAADEYWHPFRLAYQALFASGRPVALRQQTLFSFRSATACAREYHDGTNGFPPGLTVTAVMPRRMVEAGELSWDSVVVAPAHPSTRTLSVRLLTEASPLTEDDFFGPPEGRLALRPDEAAYLKAVLEEYRPTPRAAARDGPARDGSVKDDRTEDDANQQEAAKTADV